MEWSSASEIAANVTSGEWQVASVIEQALSRIESINPGLNAFSEVTADRARARALSLDAQIREGKRLGPLAGVPFAAKNLFDLRGIATLAGSRINRDHEPASRDAALVERLENAGAVLVGALHMSEYAYDFTGDNAHYGPTRNPHDRSRITGGSSGGSGAAVAGGLVPLALGSDTNGSIRVPSSFCGVFGLKPTYGRLSRARTFPFVSSLDHLGPFARNAKDLAVSFDAICAPDSEDPVCSLRPAEPTAPQLCKGIEGLRIASAGGYFRKGASAEANEALERVARALGVKWEVELPEADRARSAAYVITATEGASLHLDRLKTHGAEFDPAVRDRLIAGAMMPASLGLQAQKFRRWFHERLLELFKHVDLILAPATPFTAPPIGQQTFLFNGVETPMRPNIGMYTQPISLIGFPVVVVPVPLHPLPIGVQIIAPPWREDLALRAACVAEELGVALAPRPFLSS